MKTEVSALELLIPAYLRPDRDIFLDFGKDVGKLYTDFGLPLDMAMERCAEKYDEQQLLLILQGACGWFVEHKRVSGAPEKAIERQRRTNRSILNNFVNGKETGIY